MVDAHDLVDARQRQGEDVRPALEEQHLRKREREGKRDDDLRAATGRGSNRKAAAAARRELADGIEPDAAARELRHVRSGRHSRLR